MQSWRYSSFSWQTSPEDDLKTLKQQIDKKYKINFEDISVNFILDNAQAIALAVGDWYFDRSSVKAIDCPYPCDQTCHNLVFK